MAKHNQRNTLGSLTDFQSAPQPTPETTDERIDRLERRILQVETLLNDIMQVLDKPYKEKSNGKPNPKAKAKPKPEPPPAPPITDKQKQVDRDATLAFLSKHPDQIWHGKPFRQALKENCNLTNKRILYAVESLKTDGHLVVIENAEVDGKKINKAYKFIPSPTP